MKRLGLLVILLLALCPAQALASTSVADGEHSIGVSMTGGSGRASVESPTTLTVNNGEMTATIKWSSSYYEYMLVDEVYYYPIQTSGNSTFEIPVSLDKDMPIAAQTVAMGTPHEVAYTLHFDSSTIDNPADKIALATLDIPYAAILIATVVIIITTISLISVKRKNRNKAVASKESR